MFDYRVSKHPSLWWSLPRFRTAPPNMAKIADQTGMKVQTPATSLTLSSPISSRRRKSGCWRISTGGLHAGWWFPVQIHCLPCVPTNEVGKRKTPALRHERDSWNWSCGCRCYVGWSRDNSWAPRCDQQHQFCYPPHGVDSRYPCRHVCRLTSDG